MESAKNKISIRQLILLYVMIVGSAIVRVYPRYVSAVAGKGSWISPLISFASALGLLYLIKVLYRNNKGLSYADIINKVLGSFLGKVILVLYFFLVFILASLYLRYFIERMLVITSNVSMIFYSLTLLSLVFYVARNGLVSLARLNEILLPIVILLFQATIIFALFNVKVSNILPVTTRDILPIFKGTVPVIGILGYLLMVFFFSDRVNNWNGILKHGVKGLVLLTFSGAVILIVTVGPMGHRVVKGLSLPYFLIVKNIEFGGSFKGFESILIATWTIVDFFIITVMIMVAVTILRSIFKLSDSKAYVTPMVILVYLFSLYIATNLTQLDSLSKYLLIPANIIFYFVIPMFVLIIGKIRKKI